MKLWPTEPLIFVVASALKWSRGLSCYSEDIIAKVSRQWRDNHHREDAFTQLHVVSLQWRGQPHRDDVYTLVDVAPLQWRSNISWWRRLNTLWRRALTSTRPPSSGWSLYTPWLRTITMTILRVTSLLLHLNITIFSILAHNWWNGIDDGSNAWNWGHTVQMYDKDSGLVIFSSSLFYHFISFWMVDHFAFKEYIRVLLAIQVPYPRGFVTDWKLQN